MYKSIAESITINLIYNKIIEIFDLTWHTVNGDTAFYISNDTFSTMKIAISN